MLKRFSHPAQRTNPYPSDWAELADLTFETDLVLLRLKDTVRLRDGEDADYIVGEDYTVSLKVDDLTWAITVPRGLITDLTSVPGPLRGFAGRVGPWLEAAIVHDYLYIAWQDVAGYPARAQDRAFADLIMLRAMEAARVGVVRRRLIYAAVRVFGARSFGKEKPDRYVDLPDDVGGFSLPRREA